MSFAKLPKSFFWFGLTAVIFVLQLIPWTGIFLMMVAAPMWSIVTINIGFISLAIEALSGRTRLTWMSLPILWFGGYAAVAAYSQSEAAALAQRFDEQNAKVHVAFSPERQAIVFAEDASALASASNHLVTAYGRDVAYTAKPALKTANHLASRLGGTTLCAEIRKNDSYRDAGIFAGVVRINKKFAKDVCVYQAPEDPKLPAIKISSVTHKVGRLVLPYTYHAIRIEDDQGRVETLLSGHAAPLSWLPMPVMGCFLNSGAPSWDCSAGFWRLRKSIGGGAASNGSATDLVADALGLTLFPIESRLAAINADTQEPPKAALSANVDFTIATLDRVTAIPSTRIYASDVRLLRSYPDVVAARQDQIVEAIRVRLTAPDSSGWETARALASLLAQLPDTGFYKAARSLLPIIPMPDKRGQEPLPAEFVVRLGDLGADAVATLEALAFHNPRRADTAAVLGLCRAGSATGASEAEKMAPILAAERVDRRLHQAVYVTLLRLGRKDLVAGAVLPTSARKAAKYRTWLETVTPESPPRTCATDNGWPRLPVGAGQTR